MVRLEFLCVAGCLAAIGCVSAAEVATTPPVEGVVQLDAGAYTTCGILADGTLYCSGRSLIAPPRDPNDRRREPEGGNDPFPFHVGKDADWTDIAVADRYACGVRRGSGLWCWAKPFNQSREIQRHD